MREYLCVAAIMPLITLLLWNAIDQKQTLENAPIGNRTSVCGYECMQYLPAKPHRALTVSVTQCTWTIIRDIFHELGGLIYP